MGIEGDSFTWNGVKYVCDTKGGYEERHIS